MENNRRFIKIQIYEIYENKNYIFLAMARGTRNSKNATRAARKAIKASKHAALLDICVDLHASASNNNDRIPYGYVKNIIAELRQTWSWLTRDIINKAYVN